MIILRKPAQYVLVDGTRAFTGTVGGVTPTEDAHLATKGYVDNPSSTYTFGIYLSESVANIDGLRGTTATIDLGGYLRPIGTKYKLDGGGYN